MVGFARFPLPPRVVVGALLACAGLLSGCAGIDTKDASQAALPLQFDRGDQKTPHFRDPLVAKGVDALKAGRYQEASAAFNAALSSNPANPYLHFLNALAYHLLAHQGDIGKRDLAEVGYRQALQFDPNGWWAAYGLGVLQFEEGNYQVAQNAFAQVLLVDRGNLGALQGLAAASYYAADFRTARAAIGRAVKLRPDDPAILRSAALIAAANGEHAVATGYVRRYAAAAPDANAAQFVQRRVEEWATFFGAAPLGPTGALHRQVAAVCDDKPPPPPPEAARPDLPPGKAGPQVLVDVTYIRSQDQLMTTKGVNLLHGLQVQYGYSRTNTATSLSGIPNYEAATGIGSTNGSNGSVQPFPFAQTIIRTLTVPTLTYSLNIFNSQASHSEVVARPTLVAQQGQPSSFFSGDEITVALNGQYGGTLNPIEIGVTVDVTPTLVTDDRVTLRVRVKQSGIEPAINGTFQQALQTSNNYVTATVTLGYDQTIVLSGLTAREQADANDRTPGLSELPLLQYFFKNDTASDNYRTLLIALTPHRPDAAARHGAAPDSGAAGSWQSGLDDLQQQWRRSGGDEFAPTPNLHAVLSHLNSGALYRQLRAGDLSVGAWQPPTTFSEAIQQDLGFLYF